MIRYILAALALLGAAPAAAQTISGCSSVASNRIAASKDIPKLTADADCADRARDMAVAMAKVRRDRIAVLTPPVMAPPVVKVDPNTLLQVGDSITAWGGSYADLYAAARPKLTRYKSAVGGDGIAQMVVRQAVDRARHAGTVTIFGGANDLSNVSLYPKVSDWFAALMAYAAPFRADGAKVVVATILPQANNAIHTARRGEANALIRAEVGKRIDGVADFAATAMGTDAAPVDKTMYVDGLHPTDGTVNPAWYGHKAYLLPAYAAAVDKALGLAPPVVTTPVPASSSVELPKIATNVDTKGLQVPSWGDGSIPPSGKPDVVGAFRFICEAGQVSADDPVVYPGQPGKSHLHQFFGNTGANAYSTYESLRTTGDSTCGNILNRSAYWMPAMINGDGMVVRPDYVSIYYKRRPATDPYCKVQGIACVPIPRGLRYVFGHNVYGPNSTPGYLLWFNCDGPTAKSGHYPDIVAAAANCPAGNRLGASINAPDCWNGKDLDSADHRSHMAYAMYDPNDGQLKCPSTHRYVIPTFTMGVWYSVDDTLDRSGTWTPQTRTWYLSSDKMPGMAPMRPGSTFHSDWFGAWDDDTMAAWTANCIDKLLNCSGGDLGNGKQIADAWLRSDRANPRLVPVPAR
ncbi:DUF1996 domain-containing protein [Sphingomonas floccifaciens]|uniref:DUF1996 domain-containing protein n=1 Tax=Sphingomonas floccifaciens TaxID=1844115 RepID=A0ABW4NAM7_9SPHN